MGRVDSFLVQAFREKAKLHGVPAERAAAWLRPYQSSGVHGDLVAAQKLVSLFNNLRVEEERLLRVPDDEQAAAAPPAAPPAPAAAASVPAPTDEPRLPPPAAQDEWAAAFAAMHGEASPSTAPGGSEAGWAGALKRAQEGERYAA